MTTKKITLATIKAFIKKNRATLLIEQTSRFYGMSDCVETCMGHSFGPAQPADHACENNLGIAGVWFVFGSRDYFEVIDSDKVTGYRVYNCCGSFNIGVSK